MQYDKGKHCVFYHRFHGQFVSEIHNKTHVMLHRYSHSNDQMRMSAVEGLCEPAAQADVKVTHLRR
jgi:hypothetical protein